MYIQSFFNYLRHEKRYSEHTLDAYRSDIEQLSKYLKVVYEINDIQEAKPTLLRSWIVQLMSEKIAAKSIRRKISSIKSFYKFLLRKGIIDQNPTAALIIPKLPKRLPKTIEAETVTNLLGNHYYNEEHDGLRDQIIITLLFETGIRLSELINMSDKQLDLAQNQIRILGKGNKERIVHISNNLSILIKKYLTKRNEIFGTESSFALLRTDKGQNLYPNFVHRLLKTQLATVTTATHTHPHVMRHTFATTLLNNGADLNAIKSLLGHSSLAATQVYTHNSIEKIKKVYSQSHPKA